MSCGCQSARRSRSTGATAATAVSDNAAAAAGAKLAMLTLAVQWMPVPANCCCWACRSDDHEGPQLWAPKLAVHMLLLANCC
jgi:hypothetical protein